MHGYTVKGYALQQGALVALGHAVLLTIVSLGLATTTHAQKMQPAPEFQTVVASHYGFDETVSMLKGAMEAENLMVINEIDLQKMLRMVGVKADGIKQVFFFHRRFMNRLRDANMHATMPLSGGNRAVPGRQHVGPLSGL